MNATRPSRTNGTISLRTRLRFVSRLLASWVELRTGLPGSSASASPSALVGLSPEAAPSDVRYGEAEFALAEGCEEALDVRDSDLGERGR